MGKNREHSNRKPTKSEIFNKLKDKDKLAYEDIQELVEYLVLTNSYKYTFDGFGPEDIAQEIRKKCFLLIEKWNKDKAQQSGNPIWWFGRSIQNHLRNLRRDNNIKNPNYDSETKTAKAMYSLESNSIDASILNENADFLLMSEEVRDHLNPKHRKYYDKMINDFSTQGIPISAKKKIFDVIREVIGEKEFKNQVTSYKTTGYAISSDRMGNLQDIWVELEPSGV